MAMLQSERSSTSCYCCTKTQPCSNTAELDHALNELGMLSSVAQGRKEYLLERQKLGGRSRNRQRYTSESSLSSETKDSEKVSCKLSSHALLTETPPNSPVKPGYHIVQINRQFVTGVSSCGAPFSELQSLQTASTSSIAQSTLGEYVSPESICQKYRSTVPSHKPTSRTSRRFRKPYEVPWRYNIEQFYMQKPESPQSSVATVVNSLEQKKPYTRAATSNSSTPEKSHKSHQLTSSQRSKSLDELDLAKMNMAENENFLMETREVDNVSKHLRDLHVV